MINKTNLIRGYIRRLIETSNKDFLDEFLPLYDEWQELQDEYGPVNPKYWLSPEGEEHRLETQDVPEDLQPEYVKDDPNFYRHYSDHPSTRRATFSQTDAEVKIEKRLLQLFQKYADQSFFNGITIYHELNYHAAVQQPWGSELNYADFDRKDYLAKENSRGKDVMSCHGSVDGSIKRGYGMILKGHVVFASRGDLGSQTLRTAHKKVKQKHVGSGLPKRTGPEKVHPSKKRLQTRLKFQKRLHDRDVKRGKANPEDAPTEQAMIELLNMVVLGSEDVKGNIIEEILIDNWTIEGWYCTVTDGVPWPKEFWMEALESGITKPVYAIDHSGGRTKIDLEKLLAEDDEDSENLREYVRRLLESKEPEPDMSQYVDDLENEIFEFLFLRSTFDYLQSQEAGVESTMIMKTSLFDEYDNINEVHLGVLVNDSHEADVQAAYICIPEERSKSNLVLSINIPRNYPQIEGFQEWLSAELADALSHEIQHSCDTSEMLSSDCVDGPAKWESLENIESYYGCEAEVRGHVAGILGRARRTGQDPEDLLHHDIETVMMNAQNNGYSEQEMVPVIQRIYQKWLERLANYV